jgi:opacity protein-like surface antigen
MKKIAAVLVLAIMGMAASAQVKQAVTWTFSAKKIADKTYEVHMTANISGKYHMYAQKKQ